MPEIEKQAVQNIGGHLGKKEPLPARKKQNIERSKTMALIRAGFWNT
jgi:hypothetical protein